MDAMDWITLLFGAFAGFVLGVLIASPRFGYLGSGWATRSEMGSYLIDMLLGVVGALIGLGIAALVVM